MPSHKVTRALIELSGCPLAAPSANLSGRPSPTTAAHVLQDLDSIIPMVVDSGPTSIGVESTVVNIAYKYFEDDEPKPVLLRPGGVTLEQLQQVLPNISVYDLKQHGEWKHGCVL